MSARQFAGVLVLLAVFLSLFVPIAIAIGFWLAFVAFGGGFALAAALIFGLNLLIGPMP